MRWLLASMLLCLLIANDAIGETVPQPSPLGEVVVGAALQQGAYELFHEGFQFSKPEAIIFTAVVVGTGLTLYDAMDIPPGSQFNNQWVNIAKWHWIGMGISIGTTIPIPGL